MSLRPEHLALISSTAHYARSLAHRYARSTVTIDDLLQEGWIALAEAAESFDPERGVSFATYARRYLIGAYTDLLRRTGFAMSIPEDAYNAAVRANRADEHAEGNGRLAQYAMAAARSTDERIGEGDATLGETIAAPGRPFEETVDDRLDSEARRSDAQLRLAPLLARLTERERLVYVAVHSLAGAVCGPSQAEIAAYVGVTQGAVSKIAERADKKVRG
ncbi:hypothetical protein GCM10022288_15750 [Gryllotalpicola kribbensis]|uniref:Sigma-70 family RNA polymerase sigma factor n=1 Tax=Gryllotalpicola kribbensis TaxID=993084 RepID=A0ABP8ART4_9MICO